MNINLKFFLISLFFFLSFIPSTKVSASVSDNFFGQAWSSNIGWISFNNCLNAEGSCSNTSYGVRLNQDNTITGQAWSSNIGWINFSQTEKTAPYLDRNTGQIYGFAKVISSGEWISLNSSNVGQSGWGLQVNMSTGSISGQAWGDVSTGWITPQNLSILGIVPGESLSVNVSPSTYNVLKNQASNPISFPFTVSGSTNYQCRILDNQKLPIAGYDYSEYAEGDSYTFSSLPVDIGSYGYYLQCKDAVNATLLGTSNLITVYIAETMYTITATTSNSCGSMSPSGTVQASQGSSYTFNFSPYSNCYISSILIDGIGQHDLSIRNYSFWDIRTNHSIHIEFASLTPEVTSCTNGAINPPDCNIFCREGCPNRAKNFPDCTLCLGGAIITTPEASCPSVVPQCADALDNDKDGLTDMKDPDCTATSDTVEAPSL